MGRRLNLSSWLAFIVAIVGALGCDDETRRSNPQELGQNRRQPILGDSQAVGHTVPRPNHIVRRPGFTELTAAARIGAGTQEMAVALILKERLLHEFALSLPIGANPGSGGIVLRIDPNGSMSPEGYTLDVDQGGVQLRASTTAGLFYGVQTLLQLPESQSDPKRSGQLSIRLPAVSIKDGPKFSWRGFHLDCARHFFPTDVIKRYIDIAARLKFNRFHWHLTDDQGWRLELEGFPRLTTFGGWREETAGDGQRYGGSYSRADVDEIVRYAQARFVEVVPEVEIIGHSQAMTAAYPDLGLKNSVRSVATDWTGSRSVLRLTEPALTQVERLLEDVSGRFPGRWIHVGGDEVAYSEWEADSETLGRMRDLGLNGGASVETWVAKRFQRVLTRRGKTMVGWDEIIAGGDIPGAIITSWKGSKAAAEAAKSGHSVVVASMARTFLSFAADPGDARAATTGLLRLDVLYGWNPVPTSIESSAAARFIGVQSQLWTEFISTPKAAEQLLFPRLLALAEVAWTNPENKNYPDFVARLPWHRSKLNALGFAVEHGVWSSDNK